MAGTGERMLEVMRVISGFSGELEGMGKQASRLAVRLLALEPAVDRVKRTPDAFPEENCLTLLEIAECTRDVLDSFRETSSWTRVLQRRFYEREIYRLTSRIQETAPIFGGDVDDRKWGEDDELDRLEDIERMLERVETMKEGAREGASKEEVADAIAALVQDRRETIKSWKEIDVDELELVGGLGALTLGTFSTTRPARWRDRPVALKILADYHGVSHSTIRALREKARAHQELSSPFIVKLHGACTLAPHLCFIVEYAWKGSLAGFLHDSPESLPYPLQLAFLLDIAQGMRVLHERGILHRDLKSTNVLLSDKYQLKLCDFALADVMAECVRPTMAGTAAWMAPEELESFGATKKTDLYSFGMVCFEIATRQYPFRGMSEPQVVYEVMIRGSRPDFPNFPLEKEVVGLMEQCWQKDPAHRPDSFHSVAERLEALLSSAGGDPRKSGDLPKGASSNIDARASMLRKENNPLMWISRQSSLISDSSGGKSVWKWKPFRTSFGLPLDRKSPERSFHRRGPILSEDSVSMAEVPAAENLDKQASAPEKSPMVRADTARLEQLVVDMAQALQKQGEEAQARLDHVLAMARAARAESFETPRLACVLPPWKFELPRGLSSTEQERVTWLNRLQEWQTGSFRDGKAWFTKHLRLFLVCARTYRLVPCGIRGQGYEIRRARTWVKSTFNVLDTVVDNATAYLGVSASLNLQGSFDNVAGVHQKNSEGVTSMTLGVRESLTEGMESKPPLRPVGTVVVRHRAGRVRTGSWLLGFHEMRLFVG